MLRPLIQDSLEFTELSSAAQWAKLCEVNLRIEAKGFKLWWVGPSQKKSTHYVTSPTLAPPSTTGRESEARKIKQEKPPRLR